MWNIRAVYREKWIPADGLRAKPSVAHTHAALPCCLALQIFGVPKGCRSRGCDRQGRAWLIVASGGDVLGSGVSSTALLCVPRL